MADDLFLFLAGPRAFPDIHVHVLAKMDSRAKGYGKVIRTYCGLASPLFLTQKGLSMHMELGVSLTPRIKMNEDAQSSEERAEPEIESLMMSLHLVSGSSHGVDETNQRVRSKRGEEDGTGETAISE